MPRLSAVIRSERSVGGERGHARLATRGGGHRYARPTAGASQGGLTLVEILVSLFILAFGIWAVIRIFPRGFAVLEAGPLRAQAANLAASEIEGWKLHPESLPEAIIATEYDGTIRPDTQSFQADRPEYNLLVYNPDTLTPDEDNPLWQPDSIYWPRTIIGERVNIQAVGSTYDSLGYRIPFYLLSFAPLDDLQRNPDGSTTLLQVYNADPFTQVQSVGDLGAWSYLVSNYSSGRLLVNASHVGAMLKVDYSYIDTGYDPIEQRGPVVRTVVGEQVAVSSVLVEGAALAVIADGLRSIVPGSERVYLLFNNYKGPDPIPSGSYRLHGASRITGLVEFSPVDAESGLQVKVDYRSADWAILREDRQVPANGIVRLALDDLKPYGYTNPPRQSLDSPYRRFFEDPVVQEGWVLGAVNLQNPEDAAHGRLVNGEQVTLGTAQSPGTVRVSYRTGEINFGNGDPPEEPDRAGMSYRIFYRARADWALQVEKAATMYVRTRAQYLGYPLGRPGGPPLGLVGDQDWAHGNTFVWSGNLSSADRRTLYFALSERGKVVLLEYYEDDSEGEGLNGTTGRFVSGIMLTITGPALVLAAPNKTTEWACGVEIPETLPLPDPDGEIRARGVSLRVRVAWTAPGAARTKGDLSHIPPWPASLRERWRQHSMVAYLARK